MMQLGVVLQPDPPGLSTVEWARRADDSGFSHLWTFDSTVLWQEPFVQYSLMLQATTRLTVGPMVTNPLTRDVSVLGSTFATLNEMFGNRTVCGIGRGDSALRVVGRKPASLATLSTKMRQIKDLAEGRSVDLGSGPLQLPWVKNSKLPMWMAGYGPRALAMVGAETDGFILQMADPDIARWTIDAVRNAAVEAGRDPDSLAFCVAAPAYIGDDLAHQRDQLRWFGGMVGNHVADIVARYGADGTVPRQLTDYIAGRQGYDYSHHGRAGNPSTDFVPDEIVDRFCLLGPVEAHLDRLQELRSLGVTQFAVYLMHDAKQETLAAYGGKIVPTLS